MTDQQPRHPRRGFFAGLSPEVVRLGLVSFFADVSSEMLYPITPIFLASVLHAPVEAIGLIEGVAEAVASLFKSVFGRISDRTGKRKPFVLAGYTVAALSKPLIAVAQTWPLVLVARTADRFGKGMRTSPRDALLADYTKPQERARAFGWHRAMDSAGAVVGPLIALLLISATNNNLRLVIALTVIPGLIGAVLVLSVRESRGAAKRGAAGERPAPIPHSAYAAAVPHLPGGMGALCARELKRHLPHPARQAARLLDHAHHPALYHLQLGLHALEPGLRSSCRLARPSMGAHRGARRLRSRIPRLRGRARAGVAVGALRRLRPLHRSDRRRRQGIRHRTRARERAGDRYRTSGHRDRRRHARRLDGSRRALAAGRTLGGVRVRRGGGARRGGGTPGRTGSEACTRSVAVRPRPSSLDKTFRQGGKTVARVVCELAQRVETAKG